MPYRIARISLLVSLALAASTPLAAQYRRAPGDTLRYREETETNAELRAEQGTFPLNTSQEAIVSVSFPREGEMVAWFDSLAIRASSVAGDVAPATSRVLGQPFVLRFGPRGHDETLRTPAFPEDFNGVADLRREFEDFFIPLPAEPLRAGLEWADSAVAVDSTTPGARATFTRVGRYRVRGDTTVNGIRGLAVDAVVRLHIVTLVRGTSEQPPLRSELLGEERGTTVMDPRGVMLLRERAAGMTGDVTMGDGGARQEMRQTMRYRSRITLVSGPR